MTGPDPNAGVNQPPLAQRPLAIVYDLDDTLFPESEYARSGLRAVGQALAGELDIPDLVNRLLQCFEAGERARVYNRVLEQLGRTDVDRVVTRMVELHRAHRPNISLFPDADESLRHWRPRAKLGIISDGYLIAQRAKIVALDLESRVDAIILTDQQGREFWKPNPWAFNQMARNLGVPHSSCVYVADNPAKDFIAPNRLGWTSVRIRRPGAMYENQRCSPGSEARFLVHDLRNLPSVLGWDHQGLTPPPTT